MSGTGTRDEAGTMSVEMVVMVPVLLAVALLAVAGGRLVVVRGEVESAARDAVRAASLERDTASASAAARSTAASVLAGYGGCTPAELSGDVEAGEVLTVTLTCRVSLADLGLAGLPGTASVSADGSAVVDRFRRSGS